MNISSIGIDIQDIRRFRLAVERSRERFLKRIFTEEELRYCFKMRDPIPHLAARFSAKEAFIKALGLKDRFSWKEIEILLDEGGPKFKLSERVRDELEKRGFSSASLSISHSGDYAIAAVILERRKD